jgi:hypothetical protein
VWSARSAYVELKFANQIFTHVAVTTYILFFNFFNWPVDAADAARKAPNPGDGATLDLDDDDL